MHNRRLARTAATAHPLRNARRAVVLVTVLTDSAPIVQVVAAQTTAVAVIMSLSLKESRLNQLLCLVTRQLSAHLPLLLPPSANALLPWLKRPQPLRALELLPRPQLRHLGVPLIPQRLSS